MTDDPYTTLAINKVIMKFKYYCEMYNIGHISMWHNITIYQKPTSIINSI